jgi:hypothetical protein
MAAGTPRRKALFKCKRPRSPGRPTVDGLGAKVMGLGFDLQANLAFAYARTYFDVFIGPAKTRPRSA